MKWVAAAVVGVLASAASEAWVVERFLSADRPVDVVITNYLKAVKDKKASSKDLAELAVLVAQKGFPGDAETFFRMAIKKDKLNFEADYRLGLLLQRQGRESAAIRCYRRVLRQHPGHAYARFMLALAEERRGRRDRAIYDYAKAYHHAPELADPLKNPLIRDSRLQTEAQLLRYQREAVGTTFAITALDPGAIHAMIEAAVGERRGSASGSADAAKPTPTPAPSATPPAKPETTPVPKRPAAAFSGGEDTAPAPPPGLVTPTPPPPGSAPVGLAPSAEGFLAGRRGHRPLKPPPGDGAATPVPTPAPTPEPPSEPTPEPTPDPTPQTLNRTTITSPSWTM